MKPSTVTPKQLRSLRKRLGLSQEQLADELFVCRATVNRWEMGHRTPDQARSEYLRGLMNGECIPRILQEEK